MADDEGERLVPLRERARLTGENIDSLRAAAQDGRLPGARHDNRKRWLVPLPAEVAPRAAQGDAVVDVLKDDLAAARAELERLQAEVLALTARAARAEGELAAGQRTEAALRELVDEVKAQLSRERSRRREAEARLAQPWWKRWISG
jgi:septal ring factor EnvC (AmiA/AmiB activator)